ncbi:dihydropyrimidinase [compost metagenome]
MLHDNAGYTPYEGRTIQGWPEVVVSRGRIVIDQGSLLVERGTGVYLRRGAPDLMRQVPAPDAKRHRGRVLKALLGLEEGNT